MRTPKLMQSPYTTTRFLGDQDIVAHFGNGEVYRFNETAAFIWRLCSNPVSMDSL